MIDKENRVLYTQNEKRAIEEVDAAFKDEISMLLEEHGEQYCTLVWVEAFQCYCVIYKSSEASDLEGFQVIDADDLAGYYMHQLCGQLYFAYEDEKELHGKSEALVEKYLRLQGEKVEAYIAKLPQFRAVLEQTNYDCAQMYSKFD